MFLSYVHSFRAVAIMFVVGGHALWIFDWPEDDVTRNVIADVIENGTVLFIFIAGFFFHHLAHKYTYRGYLTKKVKNVLMPFVLMASPAVVESALNPNVYGQYPQLAHTSAPYRLGWFLVNAGAGINRPLWFVPMITLFYLAAPLFMLFVRYPRMFALLGVLIPLSLFAHRAAYPNLDILALSVYYLSAYLAGMWASHERSRLEPLLERMWPWLIALWGVMVLAMVVFADHHGNYEGAYLFSQEHGVIDWLFLQKLLLCFALLGMMKHFEKPIAPSLEFLGTVSFAVFFVHYYFVIAIRHVLATIDRITGSTHLVMGSALGWITGFAAVLGLTLGTIKVVRRVLGPRSRSIIGS
jgi:probable poly-beta-1,6-N-acetyl-D-glucosamine export protein